MIYLEVRPPIGPGVVTALKACRYEHVLAVSYPAKATSRGLPGGVHAVAFDPKTGLFTGVGDPRRDGAAAVPPGAPHPERGPGREALVLRGVPDVQGMSER